MTKKEALRQTAQENQSPRYPHDCGACLFKGRYEHFDVYFCSRCDGGTWLARYGAEPSHYASYPTFILPRITRDYRDDESIAAIFFFVNQEKAR